MAEVEYRPVGARVMYTSEQDDQVYLCEVIWVAPANVEYGGKPYLLRPLGRQYRWTVWSKEDRLQDVCPTCNGERSDPADQAWLYLSTPGPCPDCNGSGVLVLQESLE